MTLNKYLEPSRQKLILHWYHAPPGFKFPAGPPRSTPISLNLHSLDQGNSAFHMCL